MKKYKVEMTFTVEYVIDPTLYPEGSSPETCLAMDIAEFNAAPEEMMVFDDIKVKGRIIGSIE